jgi:multidrug efflux pump subunit AcrA (membrane-fusion protein)
MKKTYLSLILIILVIGSGILIWQKYYQQQNSMLQTEVRVAPITVVSIPDNIDAIGKVTAKKAHHALISYHIPIDQSHLIKLGQFAALYQANDVKVNLPAKVLSISKPQLSTNSVIVVVRTQGLPKNIKLGTIFHIKQQVGVLQQQLLVPQSAIISGHDTAYVYVVKDGRALKRSILLGASINKFVAISGDIKADDSVVIDKHDQLKNKSLVRIVQ